MSAERIRIVLVRPTHPGNIGAVARAMANMGLRRLYLVEPKEFPSPVATARASVGEGVLDTAVVTTSLAEAIADCALVIATTARLRSVNWPMLTPEAAMRKAWEESARQQVAVVFGPERTGLSNTEVDRCQYLVRIPVDNAHASINLAGAVLILAYELRRAAGEQAPPETGTRAQPEDATAEDLGRLFAHLRRVLLEVDFLKTKPPHKLMRKLVRLFTRARPSREDVNILRGILTAVERSRRRDSR